MPTPTPRALANLKSFSRPDAGQTEPLAARQTQVRLPVSADRAVAALPDRSAWLRRVIEAALRAEGLL